MTNKAEGKKNVLIVGSEGIDRKLLDNLTLSTGPTLPFVPRFPSSLFRIRNYDLNRRAHRTSPILGRLLEICPGRRHAWFDSTVGRIRKPYMATSSEETKK